MTLEELQRTHVYSHTAVAKGYVSRKLEYVIYPYSGKYGKGYIVGKPSFESTRFHPIEYWITKEST